MFKWPKYYDGQPLFYEWSRDYVKEFRLNKPNGGRLADIRQVPLTPGYSWTPPGTTDNAVDNPMDMEFGPDGALYILEYGDGYFSENPDAKLTKVNFVRGNNSPEVRVQAEGQPNPNVPLEGLPPLTVNFTSDGTVDRDGDRLIYAWDFDSDGEVDSREPEDSFTYEENGTYDATLKVTDRTGRTSSASVPITVGNTTPKVTLTTCRRRASRSSSARRVTYTVTVEDDTPGRLHQGEGVLRARPRRSTGTRSSASTGCTGSIITTCRGPRGPAEHPRGVRRLVHRRAPRGRPAADRHGPGRADPRRLTESGRDGGAAPSRRPRFPAVTPG